MNKELSEQLISLVKENIDENIPNVGVIKALLKDAMSYLEHPVVPEEPDNPFGIDISRYAPIKMNCSNVVCYCDGSCKNSTNYFNMSSLSTCTVCGGKHYDPNFKCE